MGTAVVTSSNPLILVVVALVLCAISRPIIQRISIAESNPWLVRILWISLILHLLAAPTQVYVVHHFYHGIADWTRYDTQGGILGPEFRRFDFSFANANVRGIVNDGSVSIATGVVTRTAYAKNAFTWPTGVWVRRMAIYKPGTQTAGRLTVGGPW